MNASAICEICPLSVSDAAELSALLRNSRREYIAHFHPFAFDEETIRAQITNANRDQFWAIRCDAELAGFFMLRGLDAGFARPSFGAFIAENFARRGLAARALDHALAWCREQKIGEVMLKAHPENEFARRVYERAGFVATGTDDQSGHTIFVKRLVA